MNATFKRNCSKVGGQSVIAGSGHVVERTVTVPRMSCFSIRGPFQATLIVDAHHRGDIALRIRADDNVLPFVVAKPQADAIVISLREDGFVGVSELSVVATVGPLYELSVANAASARVHNIEGEAVALHAGNGSRLLADGRAQRWTLRLANASRGVLSFGEATAVHVQLTTSSHLTLEGSAADTEIEASTASALLATCPTFDTCRARVTLNGLSSAQLCARDMVRGEVRGFSKLLVTGEAVVDVKGTAKRQ